jgi:hypothetical protein
MPESVLMPLPMRSTAVNPIFASNGILHGKMHAAVCARHHVNWQLAASLRRSIGGFITSVGAPLPND